ncbi:MAG TPA: type 4a pilus biogenesis protein PilO [Gaiellaceae bacterium]|nr:type 4a pilus biogenesis protein PilO [Gaiellaceae bacterium]
MSARLASLSPRGRAAVAAGLVLVYLVALWFLFVSPKRGEVSSLDAELVAAEANLAQARSEAGRTQRAIRVSDVLRLAKAMPSSTDQSGLVLELTGLARRSGVTLGSITTQSSTAADGGPVTIPVTVTVTGSYFEITSFLRRTRALVTVRDGKLRATGRLLAVQSVTLAEAAESGFPTLDASIVLNAYVYDGPIVPPASAQPSDELEPSGTSAAGSTS